MAGFYAKGNNSQSTSKAKKKGFYALNNADTKNSLEYDGIKFGTVTNAGLKAIQNNTLDSYTPVTEEERTTIRKYNEHLLKEQIEEAKGKETSKEASALLGANDKIAEYITNKYPLAVPTIPSVPKKEETKSEDAVKVDSVPKVNIDKGSSDNTTNKGDSTIKHGSRVVTPLTIKPVSQWDAIGSVTKKFVDAERAYEKDQYNVFNLISSPTIELEAKKKEDSKSQKVYKDTQNILKLAEDIEKTKKNYGSKYASEIAQEKQIKLDKMISEAGYSSLEEVKKAHLDNKPNVAYVMLSDGSEITWDYVIQESKIYDKEKVVQNKDFDKKSKYIKKNVKYEPAGFGSTVYTITEGNHDEHIYNLINGDEKAISYEANMRVADGGVNEELRYKYFEENEKRVFNYLWETQGSESALAYANLLSDILQSRRVKYNNAQDAKYAKEHPIKSTFGEIIKSPLTNSITGFGVVADYIDDGKIDENSDLYRTSRTKNTIYDTVRNNINSPVGKFFYNAGVNIGEQGMAMLVGGGNKFITLGTQVSGGFGNTVIDAKQRGLSDNEAFALGIVSASAEIFFESKSFDALFDGETLTESGLAYIKNNLKTELSGELGTEAVNDIADGIIAGDLSQWNLSIEQYMANGMTKGDALKKTIGDYAYKYIVDIGGTTLISTGVMSGTPVLFNYTVTKATKNPTIGKYVRDFFEENYGKDVTNDYIKDTLNFYPSDSNVHNLAQEAQTNIDAGKTVSDALLGEIYSESVNQNIKTNDAVQSSPTVVDPSTLNKGKADITPVVEQTPNEVPTSANRTNVETPAVTTPTETPTTIKAEETTPATNITTSTVNVGDVFTDTKNGDTIKIIDRDDTTTTMEFTDKDGNVAVSEFSNNSADMMSTNSRYAKVESAVKQEVSEAKATVEETQTDSTIKIGDTFAVNNGTGSVLKVVGRDDKFTTVEVDYNNGKKQTMTLTNEYADKMKTNPKFSAIDSLSAVSETTEAVETVSEPKNAQVTETTDDKTADSTNVNTTKNSKSVIDTIDNTVEISDTSLKTLRNKVGLSELFKSSTQIIIGEDCITSNRVSIPKTEALVEKVKSLKTKAEVLENKAITMERFRNNDTSITISGDAKIGYIGNEKYYAFNINDKFYVCEQRFLDHFNNGSNVIKAGANPQQMWNVFDTNGKLVGSFISTAKKFNVTQEQYNQFQSVSEVLNEKAEQKTKESTAPITKSEINTIKRWDKFFYYDNGDSTIITDGCIALDLSKEQFDYVSEEYVKANTKTTPTPSDAFAKAYGTYIKLDSWGEVTDVKGVSDVTVRKGSIICIANGKGYLFAKSYYDHLKKHSHTISVVGDKGWTIALVGYDENGNPKGMVMPIRNEKSTIDGIEMYVGDNKNVSTPTQSEKSTPISKENESSKQTPTPTQKSDTEQNSSDTKVEKKEVVTTNKEDNTSGDKKTSKKPKTKESAKTKVVETTAKLDDFGEKIGGARKDQWSSRGLLTGDLDEMNEREREKNVKKDNVWKRPNYQKLIESGRDRGLLWAINEIRKSLNQNIYYGYKATEETKAEKQKEFIETIREIQSMAENAKTKSDLEAMGEKWLIDNGYLEDTGRSYSRYVYTKKFSDNPALAGTNYLSNIRYLVKNFEKLTSLADANQFAVDTKSQIPKGFSIVGGEGSVGGKLVNGEWVKDESYSVAKGRMIIQSGFATREEALAWLKQGIAKKKSKTRFVPQQLLEVHRKGADYRDSKSVDGQNYVDTFGFKGGEFGNWMSAKDRQVSLDYGFDALKDLADALNIEDTDISFGGNLNIAFGARGQGLSGASAHYENMRRVINLTKMNGAGSLAHEWFHALDDFVGGYSNNFATDKYRSLPEKTKGAISDLITAMRYKDATQEETDLVRQHAYDKAIKSVTYQVKNQFGWVEKFENGTLLEGDTKYFKRTPTQDDVDKYHSLLTALLETGDAKYIDELSNLRKEVRGHVISKEDRDNLSFRLYALKPSAKEGVQLSRKATDFFNNSVKFGQLHSKDGDYWDSTIEMSARAFACYVADKTNKQNDYLSAHSDSAVTLNMDKDGNPVIVRAFPVGEERATINSAFDKLIEALKSDGFLHEKKHTENKPKEIRYSISNDTHQTNNLSEESEDSTNEPERNSLLSGDSRRTGDESTREQVEGLSETERKRTTEEIISKGHTEEKVVGKVKLNLVKEEAYNDDMKSIVESNNAKGLNTHFFLGIGDYKWDAQKRILVDGMIIGNDVYLRYDGKFTPQTLNLHENVHSTWDTDKTQKAKDEIWNSLSKAEQNAILNEERYKKYIEMYDGETDRAIEEFIADVLAGMSTYTSRNTDTVNNYWSNSEIVDNFKVSEYTHSTDAGGVRNDTLYAVSDPKWHTGFSERVVTELERRVKQDIQISTKSITDTSNWYTTKIDGVEYFAIYSTEVFDNPTILYASKGEQAKYEQNVLKSILEDYYNGRSNDEISTLTDQIFGIDWMRIASSVRNTVQRVGRVSDNRDASVLQRKSKRKPSRAFEDVIGNLFEIQDRRGYSLSNYANTFYSYMAKVVDGIKQAKLGADSVVNMLRGKGVKSEEIKWSGIETWLEGKKSVTKEELQEFVAGSMLQIEETTLDDNDIPYTQEQTEKINEYESQRNEIVEKLKDEWKKSIGTDLTLYNFANVESKVVDLLLDADAQIKKSTEAGKEMDEAKKQLRDMFANDDFGYDSEHQAYMYASRNPEDFMQSFDLTEKEQAIFDRFIRAKEAFKSVEGISKATQRHLLDIASSADTISRKINAIEVEHDLENSKHKPKWGEYKLNGGSNYRELVFKMPNSTYSNNAMRTHWGGEAEGVLAHARVQDIETKNGKMLFIEEIQSDWHNEGRTEGYSDEKKAEALRLEERNLKNKNRVERESIVESLSKLMEGKVDEPQVASKTIIDFAHQNSPIWEYEIKRFNIPAELVERVNNLSKDRQKAIQLSSEAYQLEQGIPDAPFKDNYHEYVLKRLIRMAVENGYDSIGWTTADIQSERWSEQYAEGYRIEYDQEIPKFLNKYGKKWGAKVGKDYVRTNEFRVTDLEERLEDIERDIEQYNDELADNPTEEYEIFIRDGLDDLNKTAEEIRKKLRGTEVWSMSIPKSMSDSVLYEGQPMYSLSAESDDSTLDVHYSKSTEDMEAKWDEALEKYGAIQKGEKPVRDIDVPRKRNKNEPISWFGRTALEAGITPNEVVDDFKREIMFGKMAHEVITDKKAEEDAISDIKELGFEGAVNNWNELFRKNKIGKKDFVFGMVLYNQAVTNKDYKLAMKLISDLTIASSESAQVLQSVRMLKKMSPDGTLYYLEKSVEKMNEEFREQLGDNFKDIEIDSELMKELYEAETTEERDEAIEKIEQNIADQIPSTLSDKWNAWRYLAMLGNIRTHARNIYGNMSNWAVRRVKNVLGAVLEKTIPAEQRTKSLTKSKESVAFAKEDAEVMRDILTGTGGKYEMANKIQQKRTIFKTKWLELIRRGNFDFLEAEDWWFLKDAYQDSLAQLITARHLDIEFLKSGTTEANEILNRVRAYAINEAKVATFRQVSELGNVINRTKRELTKSPHWGKKTAGVLLEGVMPFTNVPINIAKQGVAYSPYGLGKGIYEILWKVKKGNVTASEAIDTLSKGLTGTAIVALGVFLKAMGLIVAEPDDDDKKKAYDRMRGHQSYALVIGDHSYTIDWLTPASLPLFVGVELQGLTNGEGLNGWDVLNALSKIVDPMIELSVLQGVSDALDNAKRAGESSFVAVPMGIITSYFGQALPTLGGQIARLIDNEQRKYYIEKGEGFLSGQIKKFVQVSAKKIPFASKLLEPQIDAWGEEKTYGSVAERIIESTISPGYYSKITTTEVDEELHRLFEATGDNAVYPNSNTVKSFKENKKTYNLTAEQSREFAEVRGKKSLERIEKLFSKEKYDTRWDDKKKLEKIKEAYDKAYDDAKEYILDKYFSE